MRAALRDGRCGIGELTLFPSAGFRTTLAAEVRDLALPAGVRARARARRLAHGAAGADRRARGVAHGRTRRRHRRRRRARHDDRRDGRRRGGLPREFVERAGRPRLRDWLETPISAGTDLIARAIGSRGPRLTISTACSSGANALGIAADWIRAGRADAVLCGGADSLCRMTYSGFNALQALDRAPCRPFDRHRAGITLGEGAAMFVLEDWESAARRGAPILGEFVGYGVSADAHHVTQPRPDGAGAILAMQRALAEAGVAAEAIDYVNAHGTGTPQNDAVETRAIKHVLRRARATAFRCRRRSRRSAIASAPPAPSRRWPALLALRDGFVPPTATLIEPDPECDLDYVPRTSRRAALRTVLSNSYGFGGNNTSLILRGPGSDL